MARSRGPYDESSAYGQVQSVPGSQGFVGSGEGTYSESPVPEYGREPLQESPQITQLQKYLDYVNPSREMNEVEFDRRTALGEANQNKENLQARQDATIAESQAKVGKTDAERDKIAAGDPVLAMVDKLPKSVQAILRPSYILGKAGVKEPELTTMLEKIITATTQAKTEEDKVVAQGDKTKTPGLAHPSTFLDDILSVGRGPGPPELGVEASDRSYVGGDDTQPAPQQATPQAIEQWARNPQTGKIERVR